MAAATSQMMSSRRWVILSMTIPRCLKNGEAGHVFHADLRAGFARKLGGAREIFMAELGVAFLAFARRKNPWHRAAVRGNGTRLPPQPDRVMSVCAISG
jgi:hypothetical protein